MAILVKLDDIIDGMESQSDESYAFLDKRTGEVILINDYEIRAAENNNPIEDFPEWEHELIKTAKEIIAETSNYISLPSKYDINEYGIIEDFCWSIKNTKIRDIFYDLIKGSGAIRRFRDALFRHGIEDDWHQYRSKALREIAIEWCQEHGIDFDDE